MSESTSPLPAERRRETMSDATAAAEAQTEDRVSLAAIERDSTRNRVWKRFARYRPGVVGLIFLGVLVIGRPNTGAADPAAAAEAIAASL